MNVLIVATHWDWCCPVCGVGGTGSLPDESRVMELAQEHEKVFHKA